MRVSRTWLVLFQSRSTPSRNTSSRWNAPTWYGGGAVAANTSSPSIHGRSTFCWNGLKENEPSGRPGSLPQGAASGRGPCSLVAAQEIEASVQAANASSLQQTTCTEVLLLDSPHGQLDSWYGRHEWARAIFYRTPDGKPRVRFWTAAGSNDVPVNEADGSAGWLGQLQKKGSGRDPVIVQLRYSLWPAGSDHVGGSVVDIGDQATLDGAIDLTCAPAPAEPTQG